MAINTPLKVGFYNFFPAGGIGRYTASLLEELGQREELDVHLFCAPEFRWQSIPNVAIHPVLHNISHSFAPIRKARFLVQQVRNPLRAIAHARRLGIRVMHFAEFNHLSFPVWKRALERSGIKMAVSAHDVRRQKAVFQAGWEDRQLKAVYQKADALFVHSEFQKQELIRFTGLSGQNLHVVPHGPYEYGPLINDQEQAKSRLGLPPNKEIALFFGQIRDEKNLEGLMKAMSKDREAYHLLVAGQVGGRHRGREYYETLAKELHLEDRIHFKWGFVPAEQVPVYFSAADWVALPYQSSFTSQSGVLNISAYYGKPVLASAAPVLRETVLESDVGIAAEGNEVHQLTEGIHQLRERLQAGYSFPYTSYLKKYSWEENARITTQVYQSLGIA